jgi:acetate---CoA ligase (ADP-forming)
MAVIGPNGLGFVNVPHHISLTIAGRHKRRPGGISVISQSGAMLSGVAMAAWQYDGCGLNVLVSAGNEAITDLADYVNYLADDPETKAIGLIIEKVRRPAEFFAAVRRAAEAGKPVVALKLARNERSQRMAASHTAALTGDAWVYDVALRQAGVALAYDPEELVDRLALFDQIPPSRWTPVRKLGVVTMTGGYASLSLDLATVEGIPVPELEDFGPWIRANLPGITVPNPLDTTGLGSALWPEIVSKYAASDQVDSLLVVHPLADEDEDLGIRIVREYATAAAEVAKPAVVANCSGVPGPWAREYTRDVLALGRGLRPTLRGLQTLGGFAGYRAALAADGAPGAGSVLPALPRPAATPVREPEGDMLPFADTMRLLADHGIPVAPYVIVGPGADGPEGGIPFPGPYVVKLADVAHRTEHNAVRLGVTADGVAGARLPGRGGGDPADDQRLGRGAARHSGRVRARPAGGLRPRRNLHRGARQGRRADGTVRARPGTRADRGVPRRAGHARLPRPPGLGPGRAGGHPRGGRQAGGRGQRVDRLARREPAALRPRRVPGGGRAAAAAPGLSRGRLRT